MRRRSSMVARWAARVSLAATLAAACAPAVRAQDSAASALPARLGPAARAAIAQVIDTARAAGLPTGPLTAKAAEGVLKGADDARIVSAVRALAAALGEARATLGVDAGAAVLTAAASALRAGVTPASLRAFAHPAGGAPTDAPVLATALVTVVDLVAKGVPPDVASGSIDQLLQRHAPESRYLTLRSEVERDIRGGESPEAALTARLRDNLRQLSP